ncbi:hypothetical protein D3C72_1165930 [compost metagenome]
MVDAVGERPAEVDLHRQDRGGLADLLQEGFLGAVLEPEHHVDFRRIHALGVLVELRSARAAGGRLDLGERQQDGFEAAPQLIRALERGARERHGADRQRALIELGQESPPEERHEGQCANQQGHRRTDDDLGVRQRGTQNRAVARLQLANHPAFVLRVLDTLLAEQVIARHRCDGERDDERGEDRHEVGEAQRLQQPALDAREEEERQEDQHDDERREEDRPAHLAAGVVDDFQDRQPLVFGPGPVLAQPAVHVLHVDDGVIHQRADRDRQATERHGVDRSAEGLERQHGHQQGERYRQQRNERRAQIQ